MLLDSPMISDPFRVCSHSVIATPELLTSLELSQTCWYSHLPSRGENPEAYGGKRTANALASAQCFSPAKPLLRVDCRYRGPQQCQSEEFDYFPGRQDELTTCTAGCCLIAEWLICYGYGPKLGWMALLGEFPSWDRILGGVSACFPQRSQCREHEKILSL